MNTRGDLLLSIRLNRLFEVGNAPSEPRESDEYVAAAVSSRLGWTVSGDYITSLRSGAETQAASDVLDAIADHFTVPRTYLSGTAEEQHHFDSQLDLYLSVRSGDMSYLAFRKRSSGFSDEAAAELTALIKDVNARYGHSGT